MMLWSMGQHYNLWKQKSGGHLFKVIYPYLIVHAFPSVVIVSDSQNSVCWKEQKAAAGEAVACSLLSTSSAGELWELSVGGPLLFPPPLIGAVSTYLSCKKHFLELMQCHEKDRLLTVQWLNISYSPKRTQTNQTLSLHFWPVFLGSLLMCIYLYLILLMSSLQKSPPESWTEARKDKRQYTDSNFLYAAELLGITLFDFKTLWIPGVIFLAMS